MADIEGAASVVKRAPRKSVPTTPDPIEIAMQRAGHGSGDDVATTLLRKQARLIDADLTHRRWQIIGERAGAAVKGLTVLVGLVLVATAGVFVWSASRADGVVIQAFAVPPELERSGFTGSVISAQLLDRLVTLQNETRSARAASTYADNWGEDIKVEVPYAGVSFGELRRLLRETLGSQTRMSGELVRLGGNRVALTMRVGGKSARVEGVDTGIEALIASGARAMYRETQPYRYSVWMGEGPDVAAERRAVLTALSGSSDLNERLWAFHGLSLDAASDEETSSYHARALRLKPDFMPVIGNLPFAARAKGREEDAQRLNARAIAAYRAGQSDYDPRRAARFELSAKSNYAAAQGDMLQAARLEQQAIELPSDRTNDALGPFAAAEQWAAAHDFGAARTILADAGLLDPVTLAEVEAAYGQQPSLQDFFALATGDAAMQLSHLERMRAALLARLAGTDLSGRTRNAIRNRLRNVLIGLAEAYARSGQAEKALSAASQTPADHDAGIRARGLAAAAAGDARASEAWFARAVARTPSLPAGHMAWAEARLMRGDAAGAIEQARLAHEKGPRWADPLKLWGDALSRQREWAEAVDRYAAAGERAPKWGALRLGWAAALWNSGQRNEARARLAEARGMALNAGDRARLARLTEFARRRQ